MSDIRGQSDQFFSSKNEAMLDRLLYADFNRRTGGDLTEKQQERLVKTVRHYMKEVQAANPASPVQVLNKEVLTAVVPDFNSYLRRTGPKEEAPLQMDVNARFDRLSQDRQAGVPTPAAPDFQISLESEGSPLSRFEEVKKQREQEALREAETAERHRTQVVGKSQELVARDSSMNQFVDSDISFKAMADAARSRDQGIIAQRKPVSGPTELMPVPPDARALWVGAGLPTPARTAASASPGLAIPTGIRDRPVLPQDLMKPQDDIVAYRENEYNLYVYSGDRDWVNNNTENRYNFSVNFDPANNRPGFGYSTATNIKFKNISRIEFVKAIMPVESCDTILVSSVSGDTFIPTTDLNTNIFSYPYLQVRIPELDTNGYGTNDGLNRSFGVISFDGYWHADSSAKNKGFARMIPKFLKCQKVFYPTPLATLQKLTFQSQKPDGSPVCESKDTLDVARFIMSNEVDAGDQYYDASSSWIWIRTPTYFNRFMVTQGDRVQFKNVVMPPNFAGSVPGLTDFVSFITRPSGHLVSDIGCGTGGASTAGGSNTTGPNKVGYANCVIIKNNFQDPATGSIDLNLWGGSVSSNTAFLTDLSTDGSTTSGRFINLNHQIQIILRVITRDMDSAARLRPDNLQA